jgi:hypothetical protein
MQHHTHTALFTTISGVVGGVGKAISAKPLLLAIYRQTCKAFKRQDDLCWAF